MMQRRHFLLGLAATATALALYFAPPAGDDGMVAVTTRPTPATAAAAILHLEKSATTGRQDLVAALRPRVLDPDREPRLFAAQSWEPSGKEVAEPPPEQAPVLAAAVEAPPAVHLIGRYQEGENTLHFGMFNGRSMVLVAGASLGDDWRVESVDAEKVVLAHSFTGQKHTLSWVTAQ